MRVVSLSARGLALPSLSIILDGVLLYKKTKRHPASGEAYRLFLFCTTAWSINASENDSSVVSFASRTSPRAERGPC